MRPGTKETDNCLLAFIEMAPYRFNKDALYDSSLDYTIQNRKLVCQDALIEYPSGVGKYCNDVLPSDNAFALTERPLSGA